MPGAQTGAVRLNLRSTLLLILGLLSVICPPAAAQGPAEVAISVDRWGPGGAIRRGELTALRLAITDLGTRQRELLVRIESRDSDGDSPFYQAVLAGNPGVEQRVWMYARIPAWARGGDPMTFVVHEAIEDPGAPVEDDPTGRGVRPGRVVARVPLAMPGRIADSYESFMGVVGRQASPSLALYGMTASGGAIGEEWAPLGHERITQVTLAPGELPDRWFGFQSFGWLVWLEGSPADMSPDATVALKEWVSRGGHLVVVLPTAGQSWVTRDGSGLSDLLPRARITRREGVSLEGYRPLLTDSATIQLPTSTVVHEFEPVGDAAPGEAIRVLSGPTGDCVVARRLVGAGAVTVIGIDVNHIALRSAGLPQPERFWHRVLGQRGLRPNSTELKRLSDVAGAGIRQRASVWVDEDTPDLIARRGRATAGVLLGFMIFVTYWLVAGPAGYALMKKFGVHRHAWLGFFGVGVVFTGIAWGGATLLRPREISATHLTLLDHVYGQPVQRARTWMSVLLPEYGRSMVSVNDAAGSRTGVQSRNILVPWEGRSSEGGFTFTFPDSSSYVIESRQPSQMAVPARATIKQFRAEWSGGPKWGMPRPLPAEGEAPEEARLRVSRLAGAGVGGRDIVVGSLVHDLPVDLENVIVLFVTGQRQLITAGGTTGGSFWISDAFAYRLTAPWAPGQPLDMERITSEGETRTVLASEFIKDLLKNQVSASGYRLTPEAIWDRLVAQALFPMLEPPEFSSGLSSGQTQELARRGETHGWDLGLWFTQPCVIVLGQMGASNKDAPTPVPLSVDGRAIEPRGRTVVRWVYPLPDRPPSYRAGSESADPG